MPSVANFYLFSSYFPYKLDSLLYNKCISTLYRNFLVYIVSFLTIFLTHHLDMCIVNIRASAFRFLMISYDILFSFIVSSLVFVTATHLCHPYKPSNTCICYLFFCLYIYLVNHTEMWNSHSGEITFFLSFFSWAWDQQYQNYMGN